MAPVSGHKWGRFEGHAAILVVAVCLAAGSAAAQTRAAVGAEVGYSRADLAGENSQVVESRQGAITGVYLHLPMTRIVSVRPELLFSLRGGRTLVAIAGTDDFAEIDLELAYLELPLLARLVVPQGRFRPAVFGGPAVALQIGCDFLFITADTNRSTCGEPEPDDVIDAELVREWDLAWVAGAAIEMHLPRTILSLQGRYSEGFRPVMESGVDVRNRTIALLFGLTF